MLGLYDWSPLVEAYWVAAGGLAVAVLLYLATRRKARP